MRLKLFSVLKVNPTGTTNAIYREYRDYFYYYHDIYYFIIILVFYYYCYCNA